MQLDVGLLALPGVKLIRTGRISDARGYFAETYVRRDFNAAGITEEFDQDNQSMSVAAGTIRGPHFQIHPFAQAKLIRVARGKILDVVVDLRRASATFGKHLAIEMSEQGLPIEWGSSPRTSSSNFPPVSARAVTATICCAWPRPSPCERRSSRLCPKLSFE